ncbi:MAG: glycosyltransferase family 4 protein [Methylococcales bacterium]|nr:glycosyltransferase family 4 protein [Methylococcales bacterium]
MMRIAYFTNQYPKVSHSFIRREILALEKQGYEVSRFALRSDEGELVDRADRKEFMETSYILSEKASDIALACLSTLARQPSNFFKTLFKALKIGYRSDRGMLRHLIYFVESCVLLKWTQQHIVSHIHAHFGTNSTTVVMLAYFLGGARYSFTVHGPEEFDKPDFIALSEKIIHSQFVVAISSYGKSQLYRWIPSSQWNKVKVIHCGLDEAFLMGSKGIYPDMGNQLVCVGRLCEQKGQLLLLKSVKALKDQGIECQLVLAGDGPMRDEVEQCIRDYHIADRVKITGWISSEQVKDILLSSRGLVLPSFAEGLPVVIMESLALCRPVISTYVAGIPELVKNDENGWLVPAGDSDALTEAMKALLNVSQEKLLAMGKAGQSAVRERHNIETEATKLAKLFKKEAFI